MRCVKCRKGRKTKGGLCKACRPAPEPKPEKPRTFCGECGSTKNPIAGQCLKCGCGYCTNCKHHPDVC